VSAASSDPHDRQTAALVQSLVELYESWGKPNEAAKWRARLPWQEGQREER
jgi:hypothetical protein